MSDFGSKDDIYDAIDALRKARRPFVLVAVSGKRGLDLVSNLNDNDKKQMCVLLKDGVLQEMLLTHFSNAKS